LIEQKLMAKGKSVTVTEANADELLDIIREIRAYYAGILAADRKYVKNYAVVQEVLDAVTVFIPEAAELDESTSSEGTDTAESAGKAQPGDAGAGKEKGNGTLWIVIVGIVVILGAGGGAIWFFVLRKKSEAAGEAPDAEAAHPDE
jgi:hypothetical protein